MGLLKSVLSIGGAALGGAVGGPLGAKVGAAIGGAAGGALSNSKGSKQATEAQLAAIREARGIAGEAKTESIGYQKPYMDFGTSSVNALSGRLGLPQGAPVGGGTNALTMGTGGASGPSGPPMASAGPVGSGNSDYERQFEAARAAGGVAQDTFGQPDVSRAAAPPIDMVQGADGTYAAAPTGGVDPGTYGTTANPQAPARFVSPEGPAAYERPEAPGAFNFDVNKFQDSPILQAALRRGSQEVQSSAAAGGHLQSGATLKDLQDRAIETTYRFLDNERAFERGLNRDRRADYDTDTRFDYGLSRDGRSDFVTDRGFDYGLSRDDRGDYQNDRDYLTGRYDAQTNNLFRGVGVGQGAAGAASGAATRYGDQVAGLVTAGGDAKAQNALTQGQIGSDFATGVGGIIAGAVGNGVQRNALTVGVGDVPFVNTPASISRNITYF